jgi:uroporphyrinogen III methyltransferase/synthase
VGEEKGTRKLPPMNRAPTIAVTQAEGLEGRLASALATRGAQVFSLPAVSIEPPEDPGPLDRALEEIERFDWIVFTSRHAVDAVCAGPAWEKARERELPGLRIAAVGRATAERLSHLGVTVDLVPEGAGASPLASMMISYRKGPDTPGSPTGVTDGKARSREPSITRPLQGTRVLWPRSDIARRELPEALSRAGAEVVEPVAYRTVVPDGANGVAFQALLEQRSLDAVAFMSPSSARNLCALLARPDLALLAGRTAVASIGPTTSAALIELEAPPDVESAARTAEDLAITLLSYLDRRPDQIS